MATFTVATEQDDPTDEPDETFTVTLSSPSNATLATDPTAAGTITDDDDPPSVSVADASATEGSAVTFTVTLSPASGRDGDGGLGDVGRDRRQRHLGHGLHGGERHADLHARRHDGDVHGGDGRGHPRRARRDLHGDAVEPVERDPGDGPDGGRHDRGQRCGQQRPVVHLFNDLQPGGEPDGGGHRGGVGQRHGRQHHRLRDHRRDGPELLLHRQRLRGADVQRCAELRGAVGRRLQWQLRGGRSRRPAARPTGS